MLYWLLSVLKKIKSWKEQTKMIPHPNFDRKSKYVVILEELLLKGLDSLTLLIPPDSKGNSFESSLRRASRHRTIEALRAPGQKYLAVEYNQDRTQIKVYFSAKKKDFVIKNDKGPIQIISYNQSPAVDDVVIPARRPDE
jgi:hypothetical protein